MTSSAEAAVIVLIVAISTVRPEFAESAGYYIAPPASAVATFLMVLLVARKLKSDFILHGVLVGVVGVVGVWNLPTVIVTTLLNLAVDPPAGFCESTTPS